MSDRTKLRDVATIQKGKPPKSFDSTLSNALPYLSPEYLRGISSPTQAEPFATSLLAEEGEVILLWDGSNAGEAFRAKAGIVASTMAIVSPAQCIDREYFFYLLKSAEPHLKNQTNGTGIPHVDRYVLEEISFRLPPRAAQSKIAEILDTLDAAIRGTEAVVAKLKAMKQGLLHDLLTRGIDANGDLRPPQSEAPHLYKQTLLGWLPKEWETSKLPGLAQPNRPVIRTGPFGSSLKGEHWRETGRPVITIGSFGENGFIDEELLFIDEKKAKSMIEYEVHPGDLVFSRVADVGRSLVVEDSETGWIMSSNLMRISVEPQKLLPSLLHVQLRHSVRLRKQMSQLVNSAGRDVANSAVLLALDIAVPPGIEQIEIENAIVCNDEKLVQEEQQLDKLRLQKSGLMDDLLTGRTPVTALL